MADNVNIVATKDKYFTADEIVSDLRRLKSEGVKPTPYELNFKYGCKKLSSLFSLLENIRGATLDLDGFIGEIYTRVTDVRDLHFRYRECNDSCCS